MWSKCYDNFSCWLFFSSCSFVLLSNLFCVVCVCVTFDSVNDVWCAPLPDVIQFDRLLSTITFENQSLVDGVDLFALSEISYVPGNFFFKKKCWGKISIAAIHQWGKCENLSFSVVKLTQRPSSCFNYNWSYAVWLIFECKSV